MATTKDTLSGINGSKKQFPFTFPYLKQSDLKVELIHSSGGSTTLDNTKFSFANATTIEFNTIDSATDWQETTGAPKTGVTGSVYRDTSSANLSATFYPGSAIRSSDLNDNYTQNLYVTQEAENDAADALSNSRVLESGSYVSAITKANTAVTTANSATATANTASTNASNAVSTANTASTNATNAVNTANAADTIADNAKLATDRLVGTTSDNGSTWTVTGNNTNASTDPKGLGYAITTADTAKSTADSATTTANSAVSTANTASTNASNAVTTANTATSTANTASTNASNAVTTANAAEATANASAATVANSAIYQVVANYAALPSLNSVDNGKFYQVNDSTGIEDQSSVTGEPAGYAGDNELTVKLKSNTTASPKVWEWQEYYANDPETRYRKKLIVENKITIDEDYTLGSGNNAFSVGPVTVAANKTVTIPANSLYFIG